MSVKKFTFLSNEVKKAEKVLESLSVKETEVLQLLGCKEGIKKLNSEQYEDIRKEVGDKDITSFGVFWTDDCIVIKSKKTFDNWKNALNIDNLEDDCNFAQVDGEFLAVLNDTVSKVEKILKSIKNK